MTIRTILAALLVTLTPALASAECQWEKQIKASQCAEGQVFDAAQGACVAQTTS